MPKPQLLLMTSVIFHRGYQLFLCPRKEKNYVNITCLRFSCRTGCRSSLFGNQAAAYHRNAPRRHCSWPAHTECTRRLDPVNLVRAATDGAYHHSAQGRSVAQPVRPQTGWPSCRPALVPACYLRTRRIHTAPAVSSRCQPHRGRCYGGRTRSCLSGRCRAAHGLSYGKSMGHGQEHSPNAAGRCIV